MGNIMADLEASVQAKLDMDTDFQATLADLSDEDKEQTLADKKAELLETEVASLKEKAEKAAKAEEVANNYKIRAEKAEKKNSLKSEEKETPKNTGLDLKDIRALQDVHDEDVEEITEWAKFKGVSVAEAKKAPHIQSLLRTREEERASASAANTATSKRGNRKDSDETLLANFEKGVVPDDDEGIKRLAEAQLAQRKAEAQR